MGTKKWANNVEKFIAKIVNIKRVKASGAKWPWKEDLSDDDFIGQIKATRGTSIKIEATAVKDLIKHALISHKIPVFIFHIERPEIRYQTWVSLPVEFIDEFALLIKNKRED